MHGKVMSGLATLVGTATDSVMTGKLQLSWVRFNFLSLCLNWLVCFSSATANNAYGSKSIYIVHRPSLTHSLTQPCLQAYGYACVCVHW